jgi:hypothetical protein
MIEKGEVILGVCGAISVVVNGWIAYHVPKIREGLHEIHLTMNSRLTELIAAEKAKSREEGAAEQRDKSK